MRTAAVLQHQEAGGFLGIDDLENQSQGDVLDGFNVSLYKIPDSPPSSLDYTNLDTSSIPGYALAIDLVSSLSCFPDFTTYMLSVTGPIVPSPVTLYSVEYTNNDDDSTYLRMLLSPSPQVAAMECSIAHTYIHIHTDGSFVDLPSHSHPTTVLEDSTPDVQILKYKPVAKKIKPVAVTLPEEFRTTHQIVGDPLTGMPSISLWKCRMPYWGIRHIRRIFSTKLI